MPEPLLADAAALLPELQSLRRRLHAAPEIGLALPQTQQTVLEALEGLGLRIATGQGLGSVVALLEGARPGPAVLLRGDMDALPVVERTGLPYASGNGAMHACGHDLHIAGLVGAARLLAARRESIAGSVVFMFQPGEEGYAGARLMIEEGVLEAAGQPLEAAYGIHVLADLPAGRFVVQPGPIMASSNTFTATLHGIGGHGSQPQKGRNPVPAVAELALAAGRVVGERFGAFEPVVVTVTQLTGSAAANVIPPSASMAATVRTLGAVALDTVEAELLRLAEGIAAAHGLRAEARFDRIYPVTVNDAERAAGAAGVLEGLFGPERVAGLEQPWMGAEDFSFVLERVPGAFVFLGAPSAAIAGRGDITNHSPEVEFDDAVLGEQAAALAALALAHLG